MEQIHCVDDGSVSTTAVVVTFDLSSTDSCRIHNTSISDSLYRSFSFEAPDEELLSTLSLEPMDCVDPRMRVKKEAEDWVQMVNPGHSTFD